MGRWSGFACREDPASEGFVPRSLEQAELRLDLRRTEQGRGAQGGVPRAGYHVAHQAAARARCEAAYQGRGEARPGRRLRLGKEAVGARRPWRRPWLAALVGRSPGRAGPRVARLAPRRRGRRGAELRPCPAEATLPLRVDLERLSGHERGLVRVRVRRRGRARGRGRMRVVLRLGLGLGLRRGLINAA